MKPADVLRAVRALLAWEKSISVSPVPTDYATDDPTYRAGFSAGILAALDGLDEELRGAIATGVSTRQVIERWTARRPAVAPQGKTGDSGGGL